MKTERRTRLRTPTRKETAILGDCLKVTSCMPEVVVVNAQSVPMPPKTLSDAQRKKLIEERTAAYYRMLEDQLRSRVERFGVALLLWRQNTGGAYLPRKKRVGESEKDLQFVKFGPNGQGDLHGVFAPHGVRFEAELKTATGTERRHQTAWGDLIASAGARRVLVRSPEEFRDEVQRALDALRERSGRSAA